MNYWGKHLIIDGAKANPDKIRDKENISNFVNELLEKIGMVTLAPLWIEYCETNDPEKVGISYVQVLQDSHSSGHFCDVSNDFYMDIFSCKNFDENIVIDLMEKYFEPKSYIYNVIYRDANKENRNYIQGTGEIETVKNTISIPMISFPSLPKLFKLF